MLACRSVASVQGMSAAQDGRCQVFGDDPRSLWERSSTRVVRRDHTLCLAGSPRSMREMRTTVCHILCDAMRIDSARAMSVHSGGGGNFPPRDQNILLSTKYDTNLI